MTQFSAKRKTLGQGLSALLDSDHSSHGPLTNEISYFNPTQIHVGKYQPRKHMDDNALEELAVSIQKQGILHPLLARYGDEGEIELIAGERRLRAAQKVGLKEVPCRILDISSQEALEISLLENVQRADLSPMEEARGYDKLIQDLGYTQEMLSEKLGKSRTHLTNILRLLKLPESIQNLIDLGKLSPGHGRALLGLENMEELARKAVSEGWSVRYMEQLARAQKEEVAPTSPLMPTLSPPNQEGDALARQLHEMTGLDIGVRLKRRGGVISLRFHSPRDLDDILQKLTSAFAKQSDSV